MQTIGEKLEEARKRRGVSIREASEVTKIRGEYLASFENNSFELNIPDVYSRGFLRAYANYLKLNADKIITDYNARQLGESSFTRQKDNREFLGRMDIPEAAGNDAPPPAAPAAQRPVSPAASPDPNESGFHYNNFDKSSLIKGGLAIAGAGVLVAVILFVVLALLRSGPDEATLAQGANQTIGQELTLMATGGDIVSITVTELDTDQLLFRGPLNQGESQSVPFGERVRINVTEAQFLQIQYDGNPDGRPVGLGGRGPGRTTFPPK